MRCRTAGKRSAQVRFAKEQKRDGTHTPVDEDVDPDLPVEERILDVLPFELVSLGNLRPVRVVALALVLETVDDKRPLLLGEEGRRLGKVVQREERNNSDDDGSDPFTPTPSATIRTISAPTK